MNTLKTILGGLLFLPMISSCYGAQSGFETPDIYKDYQHKTNEGGAVSGYATAPVADAKYDDQLNELYLTWDGGNTAWEKRDEYVGAEVEFVSIFSNKTIKRVMIPNMGDLGIVQVNRGQYFEPITVRTSKFRTVVVTNKGDVQSVRFRSIYDDADGKRQYSDWTLLTDALKKTGKTVDLNYNAGQDFKKAQPSLVNFSFDSNSDKRKVQDLFDLIGNGNQVDTQETLRNWYYMDCATMSFDPSELHFDPYSNFRFVIDKDAPSAYLTDLSSGHKDGRELHYTADEANIGSSNWWKLPDMQGVVMHEMGHSVEWMPEHGKYEKNGNDCDRNGYQEGWPDAIKLANKQYGIDDRKAKYKNIIETPYEDPDKSYKYVWQMQYDPSGAFMNWLRQYNGDFLRLLPLTVKMSDLTNNWSLEDAVKYILKTSYPDVDIKMLWNEFEQDAEAWIANN